MRIWGTENPRAVIERERDSPKLNVFAPYLTRKSTAQFFFFQESTGVVYLDMISQWLVPQLQEDSDGFVSVQDGAPPHWYHYEETILMRITALDWPCS